ncbi:hypothetical protein BDZ45DRAFT_598621 [Acephala macrosclerotiorum]|nr:hypothetical protein BDZ45DRAFT_598621 [Acephala macrosclerotiorum]
MMVWTEPARAPPASRPGTEATRPGTANSNFQTVWLGEHVYSEIRRFVVIAEGYGNVICSPIYTYSGMATLKPNLPDPQQHAMIHTSPFPPEELSIEDQEGNITSENLSKDPIRVIRQLDTPEGDLGSLSRINYAKIYTVEKYVRVLNIGKVHVNSMEALLQSCFFARPADQPPQGPRKSKNSSSSRSKGSRDEREVRGQSSRSKYHHKRK